MKPVKQAGVILMRNKMTTTKYRQVDRDFPSWQRSFNSYFHGALTREEAHYYGFEDWLKAFNKCFDDARDNGTYPPDLATVPKREDFKYWYQTELTLVGGKGEKLTELT